tara:strand:- start:60661 stop:64029 length:3369 start_codon:yes stop_codon:yes gene_type:complete
MEDFNFKRTALSLAIEGLVAELGSNKKAIVNGQVDPITNELVLIRGDNTKIPLGTVGKPGKDGDPGVSIINVKLIEDPLQNNNVFIQTELSDGRVLQTTNSLNGYNGKSIQSATVDQETNSFIFTLEDGTIMEPVPVSGLSVRSISGVHVADGELVWEMTDGTTIESTGIAEALRGRGVSGVEKKENGEVIFSFDKGAETESIGIVKSLESASITPEGKLELIMDNGDKVDLGKFLKYTGVSIVDGQLQFTTNQPDAEAVVNLGPLTSVTGARIENGNEVVFLTNQPAPNDKFNIGPVENLRGKDGIGIKDVRIANDTVYVTLDDDRVIENPVSGISPIDVVGARFDQVEKELYLQLSSGEEIATGFKGDIKGDSIAEVNFNPTTGELQVRFDNEQALRTIGTVPVATDMRLDVDGTLSFKWSHEDTRTNLGSIKQMLGIERDEVSGEVTATFNDDPENPVSLGFIKSVEAITIDGDDLLVRMTGETEPQVIGSLRGPKGNDGVSVQNPRVDENSGNLLLELVDHEGNVQLEDVGRVRMTVQNVLGQNYSFVAEAGQTEFPAAHDGQVLLLVDGKMIPDGQVGTETKEVVVYRGPALTGGEKVRVVSFVSGGPSETGRGVFSFESTGEHTYKITLEDGTVFNIDTETDVTAKLDAIAIDKVEVNQIGELVVHFKNGDVKNAGRANKAINTKSARIESDGSLVIVLDDDTEFVAGNVLTNVEVSGARIDERGHLFIQMNGGGEYDAGFVATYPTKAEVGADSILRITLSDGKVLEAGMVRNPLLGSIREWVAYEGQTKFPIKHAGYGIYLSVNGFVQEVEDIDLSDPNNITLAPRKSGDRVKALLTTDGATYVKGIEGEEEAENNSFYGKVNDKMGFHELDLSKVAKPLDLTATYDGQTDFPVAIAHQHNVYIKGKLASPSEYTADVDNRTLKVTTPLNAGDWVRVENLVDPNAAGGFLVGDYNRIAFRTFNPGGDFIKGDWRLRQVNTIINNSNGFRLDSNRIIWPEGRYYIKGYAKANGVGQNALKLLNVTTGNDLLPPLEAAWAPLSIREVDTTDVNCEIKGYVEVTQTSLVALMHKCTKDRRKVGFGNGSATGGNDSSKGALGIPSNLVDLEIWRLGDI